MTQKKYRPEVNCKKIGGYIYYDRDGDGMYDDVDIRRGERFPPSQGEGRYYEGQ